MCSWQFIQHLMKENKKWKWVVELQEAREATQFDRFAAQL